MCCDANYLCAGPEMCSCMWLFMCSTRRMDSKGDNAQQLIDGVPFFLNNCQGTQQCTNDNRQNPRRFQFPISRSGIWKGCIKNPVSKRLRCPALLLHSQTAPTPWPTHVYPSSRLQYLGQEYAEYPSWRALQSWRRSSSPRLRVLYYL